VYLALGVTVDGERDVLRLWAGEHGDGEGAKYWLRVLTEIKNRRQEVTTKIQLHH
jgi:putative transposase